jgi:Na+-driven multidrug efflux pump
MKEELFKKIMEMGLNVLQQMPDVAKEYVQMCAWDHLIWMWICGSIVLFFLLLGGLFIWGSIYKDSEVIPGAVFCIIITCIFIVLLGHNYVSYYKAANFPRAYLIEKVIHRD